MPLPQWDGVPKLYRIFGFLYTNTPFVRTTKFDVVTREEGRVRVSWGQPSLPSQESGVGVPAIPNFGGSLVFIPTPFNEERPNSAW